MRTSQESKLDPDYARPTPRGSHFVGICNCDVCASASFGSQQLNFSLYRTVTSQISFFFYVFLLTCNSTLFFKFTYHERLYGLNANTH